MSLSRRDLLLFGAVASASPAALAFSPGDAWNDKKASDLSDKDLQKLLNHSPWVKDVNIEVHTAGMDSGGMGGGGGRGGRGGAGGMGSSTAETGVAGGMGGGGGGMGGGRGNRGGGGGESEGAGGPGMGSHPSLKAVVRWESARPIREAVKKELPREFANCYVISVSGMQFGGGGRSRNGQSNEDTDPLKGMEERVKQATQLQRKQADPIFPSHILSPAQSPVRYFVFPHGSQPIQVSDREVVFHITLSRIELKAKFVLKDMLYQGELAL